MTATTVQFVYELLTLTVGITMLIIVEVTVTMHIINVIPNHVRTCFNHRKAQCNSINLPDSLERDFKLLKVRDNFFELSPVIVSPAALVETESKVLL